MKWISLRLTGMQLDWDLISDLLTDLNFSYQQSNRHQTEIKPESRKLMERFGCYVAFKLNLSDSQNFQRICPSDWLQWKLFCETRSIPHRCTTKKYFKQKKRKIFKIISATLDEWRHTNLPFWIGSEISELLSELFSDSVAVSAANLTYFDLEPR